MNLYEYQDETITTDTFVEKLSPYIQKGDTLELKIDTMRFGKIAAGIKKSEFLDGIFDIFYKLVGEEGNIVIPTFSYSWGMDSSEKIFDVQNTPGKVGIFPEYFRKRKDILRTLDPMFSFVIWGKDKKLLSQNKCKNTFGKNSLYNKIHQMNAKLISFGLVKYDPTFIHYVEQYYHENIAEIEYRFIKKFEGPIINYEAEEYEDYQYCFSRYLDKFTDLGVNEKKLTTDLKIINKLNEVRIGNACVNISDCVSVFDVGVKGMKVEPFYFMEKDGVKGCMMDKV